MDQEDLTLPIIVGVLVLGLAGAGYWWWQRPHKGAPAATVSEQREPNATTATAPAEPAIRHPIETLPTLPDPGAAPPPPLDASDASVRAALAGLLGPAALNNIVQADGFINRVTTTVDNLGLDKAPSRLWPVQPTPGRFMVMSTVNGDVIAADNAQRYAPFVRLVEGIDTPRAVALYVRLYPLFQQAYAGLGYPRNYFNDKLVAAIDHLLEAPVPSGPIGVQLTEVKGPVASVQPSQPWTRYEFADPGLQALSAGQKIMVRMGNDNELRLKAKLSEFRRGIASGSGTR